MTGKPPASPPEMVQLEVPCEVLRRLLRDHRLVACELRCLNGHSRDLVREAVKDCLRTAVERRRESQPPADA